MEVYGELDEVDIDWMKISNVDVSNTRSFTSAAEQTTQRHIATNKVAWSICLSVCLWQLCCVCVRVCIVWCPADAAEL